MSKNWKDLKEEEKISYILGNKKSYYDKDELSKEIIERIEKEYPILSATTKDTEQVELIPFIGIIGGIICLFVGLISLIISITFGLIVLLIGLNCFAVVALWFFKYAKTLELIDSYNWEGLIDSESGVISKRDFYKRQRGIDKGDKILSKLIDLKILNHLEIYDRKSGNTYEEFINVDLSRFGIDEEKEFLERKDYLDH